VFSMKKENYRIIVILELFVLVWLKSEDRRDQRLQTFSFERGVTGSAF
jgi:hypothetical protein